MSNKPRVIKDYDKLAEETVEQIKLAYPYGFDRALILFTNPKGKLVSALPFETDEKYYLVRMTKEEAQEIIEEDDDYNDQGNLKKEVEETLAEKYDDDDAPSDEFDDDDDDF